MLTVAVPKRNKLPNIIVLTPKDGRAASPLDSHMYIPAAPTAATASLPMRPIQIMSVKL